MKVLIERSEDYVTVYLAPFMEDDEPVDTVRRNKCIEVSARKSLRANKWEPAEVNWAGIGSVGPDKADKMGKALIEAAELARKLDYGHHL